MAKKRVSDGMVPIYAKITIDNGGGSKQICTNVWLRPENWDLKDKIVLGDKKYVGEDNDRLAMMRLKLKDVFKELELEEKKITAELLKKQYLSAVGMENGNDEGPIEPILEVNHTLLETIDDFIIEFEKMVDLGHRSKETLKHWHSTRRKCLLHNTKVRKTF
ncbi:Arm DNA-binding domain-containing protein [Pedobacter helvus]|uniref:Arm DNA-binding domain-containing protein n=1 Tax=Pedobacter helvus TaxID=2563444 RepID=A0ABW9JKH0_9SPHI|nr:Arm DNA-binding domain-containing protein [Pedobacter ureilyticus]